MRYVVRSVTVFAVLTAFACQHEPEAKMGHGDARAGEAEATAATGDTVPATEERTARRRAEGASVLDTDRHPELGRYVTDDGGRALYLFAADPEGQSTCRDECARAWPPYLAESDAPYAGTSNVRSELIGTVERRDGSTQVTYAGHPLYHCVQDEGTGSVAGQDVHGFGGEWYLVTPSGEALGSGEGGARPDTTGGSGE